MLGSSLAVQSRETMEEASLQQGRAASLENDVSRLQKLSGDLEQQLVEAQAREQRVSDEFSKLKDERDTLADKVEKAGILVVELRESVTRAKKSVVEEFKSSSDFLGAVEDFASKYFGEGFDFYKRQLRRHHPELAIDLESMGLDHDLLTEEREGVNEETSEKDKGDTNPLPS